MLEIISKIQQYVYRPKIIKTRFIKRFLFISLQKFENEKIETIIQRNSAWMDVIKNMYYLEKPENSITSYNNFYHVTWSLKIISFTNPKIRLYNLH